MNETENEIFEEIAAVNLQDLARILRRVRNDEAPEKYQVLELVRQIWEED